MFAVLLVFGLVGISTIHASSQTDHHPADINQSHQEVQREIARGSIEMSRAKLIGALSDYGPYLTKALLHTAGALSNLSQLNNTIDFIPVEGEVRDTILTDPQGFINSCARVHGRDFYCLEITNGGLFSASFFPNFFRRFYISNQNPTDTGHLAINDCKVVARIYTTLKEKKPIGNILAHSFIKHPMDTYIPPSDVTFILVIIDRTTQSVYLVTNDYVPGKYENVFTPSKFDKFLQKTSGGISAWTRTLFRR